MPVAFPAAGHARAVAQSNQGVGLFWAGRPAAARAVLHPALDAVTGSGMELTRLNCLSYLGLSAAFDGRLDEAATWSAQGRRLAEERGWMSAMQAAGSYLTAALVNLVRGKASAAKQLLRQGAPAMHEPTTAAAFNIAEMLVDISLGRADAGLRSARNAPTCSMGMAFRTC